MKARISAMICLLCALGSADLVRADDPYSQRVADPYALSPDGIPNMSSGTLEPYLSFFAGVGIPFTRDATFTDGTTPTIVKDVDYQSKFSLGGNLGVYRRKKRKEWKNINFMRCKFLSPLHSYYNIPVYKKQAFSYISYKNQYKFRRLQL